MRATSARGTLPGRGSAASDGASAEPPAATPVVFDNKGGVFMDYRCAKLDMAITGESVVWATANLLTCIGTPVLVDGYLYGTSLDNPDVPNPTGLEDVSHQNWPLRCVDWKTGEVVWENDMQYVSVIAASGKLIMLDIKGILHVAEASPSGYHELAVADMPQGAKKSRVFAVTPVLCGGRIYCRNYAGDLVCIDVSK